MGVAAPAAVALVGAGLIYAYWKLDVWGYWFERWHLPGATSTIIREPKVDADQRIVVPGVFNTAEKIGDIPSSPEKIGDPVADESHEIFVSSSKSDWRRRLHSLAIKLEMLENYGSFGNKLQTGWGVIPALDQVEGKLRQGSSLKQTLDTNHSILDLQSLSA